VYDLYPGDDDAYPYFIITSDGYIYFSGKRGFGGRELWRTNGVGANLVVSADPGAGAILDGFQDFEGYLYFHAENASAGNELWRTNSEGDTSLFADVYPGPEGSFPRDLTVFNDLLYFVANGDGGFGYELWQTNGDTFARAVDRSIMYNPSQFTQS